MRTPSTRGDDGSAIVEFVMLGTLLLLPVVYLIVALSRIQAAGYAAESSARAAARAMASADDDASGRRAAAVAVGLGLGDQGFDVDPARALTLDCAARPCLTPQARISATVTVDVLLPGVPAFLDGVIPMHSRVSATQVTMVDRFRESGPAAAPRPAPQPSSAAPVPSGAGGGTP